jgi:hypothetical protein
MAIDLSPGAHHGSTAVGTISNKRGVGLMTHAVGTKALTKMLFFLPSSAKVFEKAINPALAAALFRDQLRTRGIEQAD